jgi:hypothetical protein
MLYLMAAVVANPEFVVLTIRDTEGLGRPLITHYLAGSDIVELVATADGRYQLGIVPDRATLTERIKSALGLHGAGQQLRIQFFTEETVFEKIKDLSKADQRKQAVAALENLGLGGLSVNSLLVALGAPETNEVLVVKTENGQVKTGRRAWLLRGGDIVWLAKRVDATSTTLSVEAMQADTLPKVLDSFIQFLSQ